MVETLCSLHTLSTQSQTHFVTLPTSDIGTNDDAPEKSTFGTEYPKVCTMHGQRQGRHQRECIHKYTDSTRHRTVLTTDGLMHRNMCWHSITEHYLSFQFNCKQVPTGCMWMYVVTCTYHARPPWRYDSVLRCTCVSVTIHPAFGRHACSQIHIPASCPPTLL